MQNLISSSIPVETEMLVAFSDLTEFAKLMRATEDREIFELMHEYAAFAGGLVKEAGGHAVKFIGDAMLIVFQNDKADAGVRTLLELKSKGDDFFASRGLSPRHRVKAHFGPVVCGPLGAPGDERFDVYGKTVNEAAVMASRGVAISPQAFRKLDKETRMLFKKHTPPVTYIRVEDKH